MSLAGKGKPVFSRIFPGHVAVGFRTIITALVTRPILLWPAGTIVLVIMLASFLMVSLTAPVSAAPEEETPLECSSCHTRVLKGHDKLGSGSAACWVCHDSVTVGKLRLADGTQLPLADSTQLCGQCHRGRYEAWNAGTHGVLAGMESELEIPGAVKMKCIDCHNPHEPKIALTAITEPHPLPVPVAPGEETPLDCLSCHARALKAHDKLGEGSEACWACHYDMEMGVLHLAGGETQFSLSAYPQLCAQCHQKRYEDWTEGIHGVSGREEEQFEVGGAQRVGCIGCHDPHQPQVVLLNLTKPHPAPAPSPSPPPVTLLIMLGVSLLFITVVGIILARQGEGP